MRRLPRTLASGFHRIGQTLLAYRLSAGSLFLPEAGGKRSADQRGSSLLLTALAITILAATALTAVYQRRSGPAISLERERQTRSRVTLVEAAIEVFAKQQSPPRLPCPATPAAGPSFGMEASNADSSCVLSAGILPFLSIGLSAQDAVDGYGAFYGYRTAANGANVCQVDGNVSSPALQVVGDVVTTNAHYAIISSGSNRAGGLGYGKTFVGVPPSDLEKANCLNAGVGCTATTINNRPYDRRSFDDFVRAKTLGGEFTSLCRPSPSETCSGTGVTCSMTTGITGTAGSDTLFLSAPNRYPQIDLGTGNDLIALTESNAGTTNVLLTSQGTLISANSATLCVFGSSTKDEIFLPTMNTSTCAFAGAGDDYIVAASVTNREVYYHGGSGDDIIVINVTNNLDANSFYTDRVTMPPSIYTHVITRDGYASAGGPFTPPTTLPLLEAARLPTTLPPSDGSNGLPSLRDSGKWPATTPGGNTLLRMEPAGVYGGAGYDVLVVRTAGTINMTPGGGRRADETIREIEEINLVCPGAQSITLSPDTIASIAAYGVLKIIRNSLEGDIVALSTFGGATSSNSPDGTYTFNGATVEIRSTTTDARLTAPASGCSICSSG